MVNYLNSKPFLYGLEHGGIKQDLDIVTATPSACARMFQSHEVDVALLPVGILAELHHYHLISDFCIGCDGDVRTVCIFSNQEWKHIKTLYLDPDSKTSVLLAKILLEEYLGIQLDYQTLNADALNSQTDEAVLLIGDKVFLHEKKYRYRYDLGSLWKQYTGLPFVFAVWVAQNHVDDATIQKINHSLSFGIDNLQKVISMESSETLDLYYYFKHNIQYQLDEKKRTSMNLFLEKSKKHIVTRQVK